MKRSIIFITVLLFTLFSVSAELIMKNLYIPISSTGQVMKLDLDTLEPIGDPITVGTNPNSATISPDGRYLYVSNSGSYTISAIDTQDDTVYNIDCNSLGKGLNPSLSGISYFKFSSYHDSLVVCFEYENTGGTAAQIPKYSGIYVLPLNDYKTSLNEYYTDGRIRFVGYSVPLLNSATFDYKVYAVMKDNRVLFEYNEGHGQIDRDISLVTDSTFSFVTMSPDGKYLLVSNGSTGRGNGLLVKTADIPEISGKNYYSVYGTDFPRNVKYGDFSRDAKYIYYISESSPGHLFKTPVDDLTSFTDIVIDDGVSMSTFGISERNEFIYIISSNKVYKVNLATNTVECSQDLIASTDLIGCFMPTAAGFQHYRDLINVNVSFDYNGYGGENFTFEGSYDSSVTFGALIRQKHYQNWPIEAKDAVADWENKVLNPSSSKAEFLGWYTDSDFTDPADFDIPIKDSVTFYAKWAPYQHTWKYYSDGKNVFAYCTNPEDGCKFHGESNAISLEVSIGNYGSVGYTIIPTDASNKSVSWSSDDTNVAVVDRKGQITAVDVGSTRIRVSANDTGKVSASLLVKVHDLKKSMFKTGSITKIAYWQSDENQKYRIGFRCTDAGAFEFVSYEYFDGIKWVEDPDISFYENYFGAVRNGDSLVFNDEFFYNKITIDTANKTYKCISNYGNELGLFSILVNDFEYFNSLSPLP